MAAKRNTVQYSTSLASLSLAPDESPLHRDWNALSKPFAGSLSRSRDTTLILPDLRLQKHPAMLDKVHPKSSGPDAFLRAESESKVDGSHRDSIGRLRERESLSVRQTKARKSIPKSV